MDEITERIQGAAGAAQVPYPSPETVIAEVLADGRGADADGIPRVGRMTRKKAHAVTRALRDAGWRIIRQ
jgi:hypothetical protein